MERFQVEETCEEGSLTILYESLIGYGFDMKLFYRFILASIYVIDRVGA